MFRSADSCGFILASIVSACVPQTHKFSSTCLEVLFACCLNGFPWSSWCVHEKRRPKWMCAFDSTTFISKPHLYSLTSAAVIQPAFQYGYEKSFPLEEDSLYISCLALTYSFSYPPGFMSFKVFGTWGIRHESLFSLKENLNPLTLPAFCYD